LKTQLSKENQQHQGGGLTYHFQSRTAALAQLHRAIITSPEPVPDTTFTLNFQDQPFGTAWSYAQAANPRHRGADAGDRSFLMPHFSFWAWKLPFIGSVARAAAAIKSIEQEYDSFSSKIPRAIWRGTSWYNSVHNLQLRQSLLRATKEKAWADVETLRWNSQGDNATNAIPVEDFCRYKYVLHTEGVTYSGRFQFLQMCASVTITPSIQWLQHTTHLIRPLFASDIPELKTGPAYATAAAARERARAAWPVNYRPDEANIVFVAPDWSDLEDTVLWLEKNPKVASGIAKRQRDLFAGGGYFSQAAEVCYWRALVRGWNKVAKFDHGWDKKKGVPYERFSLTNGD
jgi:hypothetical protein